MSMSRRALVGMIERLWFNHLKELIEPFICRGMEVAQLNEWEFVPSPPKRTYDCEQVRDHLEGGNPPPIEMLNWLLAHYRIRKIRAKRLPDLTVDITWEYLPRH